MNAITYSEARAKLADTINRVCEDHNPIVITKKNDKSVVMISLDDYEAMAETTYLLRSPKNAQRLLESIRELESGKGRVKELVEE
jgi:antitoxin YefM